MEKARIEHPKAYEKTIQLGNSLSQRRRMDLQDHGLESFAVSLEHETHRAKASEIIRLADPVLVVSTGTYWEIERAHPKPKKFMWKGYKMANVFVDGKSGFFGFEKGSEMGLVAPISECQHFTGMPSLKALCLHCDGVVPFEKSIVCNKCLSTVYCSQECKSHHTSVHVKQCNEERGCAVSLVRMHRESELWPFVVGLFDSKIVAVPFENAIQIPLVPTMLLEKCPHNIVKVLVLNNELVRQCNQDFDWKTARAEAMARQLLEDEDTMKQTLKEKKRNRKMKSKRITQPQFIEMMKPDTKAENVEGVIPSISSRTPSNLPAELVCAITQEIMTDPVVICCCGYTFERSAIEKWFLRSNTNPMTGEPLANKCLVSNINLKIMCQTYIQENDPVLSSM